LIKRRPARLEASDKAWECIQPCYREARIPDASEGEPPGRTFVATRRVSRVLGDRVSNSVEHHFLLTLVQGCTTCAWCIYTRSTSDDCCESTCERNLLRVLPGGVLGSRMYGGYHNVCSGCSSRMRVTERVSGTQPLYSPWLPLRHRQAVQAEGGRDDCDLDALPGCEDRRSLRFDLAASRTDVRDFGPIKLIEGAPQTAKP
jgi:hypothetical protein